MLIDVKNTTPITQDVGEIQACIIDHIPFDPYRQPWVEPHRPYDQQIWPSTSQTITLANAGFSNWNLKTTKKGCTLSRDLPGVRSEDIELSFEDGLISLNASRHDTGDRVVDHFTLGEKYDPNTIQAVLEYGVLTLTARLLPGHGPKQITVKEK